MHWKLWAWRFWWVCFLESWSSGFLETCRMRRDWDPRSRPCISSEISRKCLFKVSGLIKGLRAIAYLSSSGPGWYHFSHDATSLVVGAWESTMLHKTLDMCPSKISIQNSNISKLYGEASVRCRLKAAGSVTVLRMQPSRGGCLAPIPSLTPQFGGAARTCMNIFLLSRKASFSLYIIIFRLTFVCSF